MRLSEVKTVLRTVTYKPGWKIEAEADYRGNEIVLRFTMPVPCRDTGNPIVVCQHRRYPEDFIVDQRQLLLIVRDGLKELECHECDEMLLVGGERLFDPHR